MVESSDFVNTGLESEDSAIEVNSGDDGGERKGTNGEESDRDIGGDSKFKGVSMLEVDEDETGGGLLN